VKSVSSPARTPSKGDPLKLGDDSILPSRPYNKPSSKGMSFEGLEANELENSQPKIKPWAQTMQPLAQSSTSPLSSTSPRSPSQQLQSLPVPSTPLAQTTLTMNANAPWGWGRGKGDVNPLTVTTVLNGTQAERAGVCVGWTINGINGVPVNTEAEFKAFIASLKRQVPYSMPAWVNVTFDTTQRPTPTTTTTQSAPKLVRQSTAKKLRAMFAAFHGDGAEATVASEGGPSQPPPLKTMGSFHGDDASAALSSAAASWSARMAQSSQQQNASVQPYNSQASMALTSNRQYSSQMSGAVNQGPGQASHRQYSSHTSGAVSQGPGQASYRQYSSQMSEAVSQGLGQGPGQTSYRQYNNQAWMAPRGQGPGSGSFKQQGELLPPGQTSHRQYSGQPSGMEGSGMPTMHTLDIDE